MAALRRHAAARLDRPRAVVRPRAAPDGRAVRRARRDDARAAEHGAAPHLGEGRQHDRLRHALDRRGGVPLDARRRDVAPGPGRIAGIDRRRPAAAAHGRDARGPALLRAGHRGARGARRRGDTALRRWSEPTSASSSASAAARRSATGCPVPARRLRARDRALAGPDDAFHVQTFLLPKPSDIARRSGTTGRALARRAVHAQGGARRLRDRLRPRDPRWRSCSRASAASARR